METVNRMLSLIISGETLYLILELALFMIDIFDLVLFGRGTFNKRCKKKLLFFTVSMSIFCVLFLIIANILLKNKMNQSLIHISLLLNILIGVIDFYHLKLIYKIEIDEIRGKYV